MKAELTMELPSCFELGTSGLEIQHLSHQVIACLDLPIFFLYMTKQCTTSVMYSYSNRFIFCTIHFSFIQLTIKQNKCLLLVINNNCGCLILVSNNHQPRSVANVWLMFYSNVWPFVFNFIHVQIMGLDLILYWKTRNYGKVTLLNLNMLFCA